MRSIMRSLGLAATATAMTVLATLAWSGPAGAAPSGAERLYAPSALVLDITAGEDAYEGTILRAVTLSCSLSPAGTHPDPSAACAELRSAGAEFDAITDAGRELACTREWDPVTVTASGVWEGRRVSYEHTFANRCALRNGSGAVFSF
ncbi:SSI family serine proteinase inhibitor [Streptomyces sp. NPDC048603]|uniref:SSI family serine proteinase inhibitor n=1 Tax=Streptomyces sp. NPDC048603 TaxID=3365577 RepID=UPI00371B2381